MVMNVDFSSFDMDELCEAAEKINQEKSSRKSNLALNLVNTVHQTLHQIDMSFEEFKDFAARQKGTQKAQSPAKYRNPHNALETWSGKGRQPGWYIKAKASGMDESQLLIK